MWASYKGHLPVVRELVKVYKADLLQKDKVCLTLSHALVRMHIFCHNTWHACKMVRCYVSSLILQLYMHKRVVICKKKKQCTQCIHRNAVCM